MRNQSPARRNRYVRPPKRSYKRIILGVLLVLVLAGGTAYAIHSRKQPASSAVDNQQSSTGRTSNPTDTKLIHFIATGDMLPHDTVTQNAKTGDGSYDYLQFFQNVQPYFKGADISFCNQESPSASGLPISGYPTFNAPPQFPKDLHSLGCNLINLANNHAYDKSQTGINKTLDEWDGMKTLAVAGINRSQQEQDTLHYFTVKGVKFAFLSYAICSNSPPGAPYSLNMLQKPLVGQQIAEAKQHADMIIAATHWCHENVSKEDATADQWADYFASQGVDIVVGTGPHWLQPVKKLPKAGGGETLVWFSLGNFLSTQEEVNGLIGGIAVMDIDPSTKKVVYSGFMPTYMHYEWTAEQKASEDLLARKNLMLYPLDLAGPALAKSQNNTTVEAQTKRVSDIMNTYTTMPILTSKTFSQK